MANACEDEMARCFEDEPGPCGRLFMVGSASLASGPLQNLLKCTRAHDFTHIPHACLAATPSSSIFHSRVHTLVWCVESTLNVVTRAQAGTSVYNRESRGIPERGWEIPPAGSDAKAQRS